MLDLKTAVQRRLLGALAGTIVLLGSLIALAPAIMIADATLAAGNVTVSGKHGVKSAAIMWEGTIVTQANKGGAFSFTTAIAPQGCIGTLSDGMSTMDVPIIGCTVALPPPTAFPATDPTACWDNGRSAVDCIPQ